MSLNDLDLIDEINAGSQAAFDQLMRRYEHLVYRIAYSYTRNEESALDITQNVFIKVHRKLHLFGGRSSFSTWLSKVAQNESLSWLSSQKRHTGHVELDTITGPSEQPVQESALVKSERTRDLLVEIHRLNPKQRQAVLLRYFESMPVRDIGEVLECSEGQVKNLLFRGLKKLRSHLSRQGGWNQELES